MIDNFDDNVTSTAFVDARGRTRMKQQLLHESASEAIEEMPREHASSLCNLIRVGSLELPIIILQKRKTLFAAEADISLARGACNSGDQVSYAGKCISSILRMSG
jgi:hypothetical protein